MSDKQTINILIIGENNFNSHVCEYFSQKGFTVVSVSDVFSIRSFSGEIGNFTVNTNDSELKTDFVLITEHPSAAYEIKQGSGSDNGPVVFLLDYVHESPPAASIYALKNATLLARKKRKVYYLAKYIRTAGQGVEDLYKEARKTGVVFYKYSDLQMEFNTDNEEYLLQANDLFGSTEPKLSIQTKNIFIDNNMDVSKRFAYISTKLNLNTNKHGFLTEDRYFLAPALTSRRGVFHLTRDLAAERPIEVLDFILVNTQLFIHNKNNKKNENSDRVVNTATIDGKKCVFCYNCYRSCTHAALEPDLSENQMQCLSNACEGCGICAGICPANAIALKIKHNTCPPVSCRSLVICCENSAIDAVDSTENIDYLTVPCGGAVDLEQLSGKLSLYDKIAVVVCPDDACRHFKGNKRASAQVNRLQKTLEAAGLDCNRISIIKASNAMQKMLHEELKELLE